MPRGRRSPSEALQIARRRDRVCQMYLEGRTFQAIAIELGVSTATAHSDVKAIKAEWLKSAKDAVEERLLLELEKINYMEAEAWAAWHRSKSDAVTTKVQSDITLRSGRPEPESQFVVKETVERLPDLRYIDFILKCSSRRLELLGLIRSLSGRKALQFPGVDGATEAHRLIDHRGSERANRRTTEPAGERDEAATDQNEELSNRNDQRIPDRVAATLIAELQSIVGEPESVALNPSGAQPATEAGDPAYPEIGSVGDSEPTDPAAGPAD